MTGSDYANLDRPALEKRLREAEAAVERLRPPRDRWERGERTPQNEDRVRPFLDKVFAASAESKARPYEVECHGDVCKLTVVDRDAAPANWRRELQTSPDRIGLAHGFAFGPDGTFIEVDDARPADPQRLAGVKLLASVANALEGAAAIAACKKDHPSTDTMTITISFDPAARKLVVQTAGPLANQPGGVCIRHAIEDILATIAIPPDVTSMQSIPVPLDAL